jgi:hypothetical protein
MQIVTGTIQKADTSAADVAVTFVHYGGQASPSIGVTQLIARQCRTKTADGTFKVMLETGLHEVTYYLEGKVHSGFILVPVTTPGVIAASVDISTLLVTQGAL